MKQIFLRLAVILCIALLPKSVMAAYDFTVDGIYYNIVSLSDLTCEVTSVGNAYRRNIIIPNKVTYNGRTLTVTSIGEGAFRDCNLKSLTIPNSVTTIHDNAFDRWSDVSNLVIEDGDEVLELGCAHYWDNYEDKNVYGGLFKYCELDSLHLGRNLSYTKQYPAFKGQPLRHITIGNAVDSIGKRAFEYCDSLKEIIIPDSVTSIGGYAFSGCYSLKNVVIGNSVTSIGGYAFSNCDLKEIIIPNSVTSIGDGAFDGCENLSTVVIEDGEKSLSLGRRSFAQKGLNSLYLGRTLISYNPFSNNMTLNKVVIGNSVTSICYGAFESCNSLKEIIIPNSVTSIGGYAFRGCGPLKKVVIGNSVTSIGGYAFSGCYILKEIIIPNSVTSIGGYAFSRCDSLKKVVIGNSVTSIGNDAFSYSPLEIIYSLSPVPPTYGGFLNKIYLNSTLYVPYGSLSAYQAAEPWKNFWNISELAPTGIKGVEADKAKPIGIYDIQGRKLNAPKKGLNIIDGKKVMVK